MKTTLSASQLGHLLALSRAGVNRRRLKRYLRDHGLPGTAGAVDAALASIDDHSELPAIATACAEYMPQALALAEKSGPRVIAWYEKPLDCEALLAAARAGDGVTVIRLCREARDIDAAAGQELSEVMRSILFRTPSDEQAAARLDLAEALSEAEYHAEEAEQAEEVYRSAIMAWRDACYEVACDHYRSIATDDGRYGVVVYYRKTMNTDGNCRGDCLSFHDRDDAEAWWTLCNENWGFRTSPYNASIVDSQPEETSEQVVDDE